MKPSDSGILQDINVLLSPVVNGDVSLEVELTVMELDNREAGAADHVDLVHTRDTLNQDPCHKVQHISR